MNYRIAGLAPDRFQPLFALSDTELAELGAQRTIADAKPGFPCRISLEDAGIGEELILIPYQHQAAATPYRAAGPIFVRKTATMAYERVNEVPASSAPACCRSAPMMRTI